MAVPPDLPTDDDVAALVGRWRAAANEAGTDRRATRLAALLADPDGPDFAIGLVDRVLRPDDPRVAATELERLSRRIPRVLPWHLRALVSLGGGIGLLLPRLVVPAVRRTLRGVFGHLVVESTPRTLEKTLTRLRADGFRVDLSRVGGRAAGRAESATRLDDTRELLARDDVDSITISLPSLVPQLNPWGFDETVARAVGVLAPLYEQAARHPKRKFLTLDMELTADVDLTLAVFTRLLERPGLQRYEAGIVLQAYRPESQGALAALADWARARVEAGGGGIQVRLVKGGSLALERVDATLNGWPLATWATKDETDAAYTRMIAAALDPANARSLRLGVATHDLAAIAFATRLAARRGVDDQLDVEMLLGVADAAARAVRADVRRVRLWAPVVDPDGYDAAVDYLVGRLHGAASGEGSTTSALPAREALVGAEGEHPPPRRTQNRLSPPLPRAPRDFRNDAPTDLSLVANRVWARGVLERAATSQLGADAAAAARVDDPTRLDAAVRAAEAAGRDWSQVPAHERAELLDRAGEVLAVVRGRLVEIAVSEAGLTLAEADAEAGSAIDFAHHSAERARELGAVRDARFVPESLVRAATSAASPLSDPAGRVFAALAAGSAVVLRPASEAVRCAAVLVDALREAGVPRELVTLVDAVADDCFAAAPSRGGAAIIVTPAADAGAAVADIVASAFPHAGQREGRASLVILVGSMGEHEDFRRRLADAVATLAVGYPQDAESVVGPLLAPVGGALERSMTTLAEGESWLVKPRQLDASDRLWSPGVRDGVVEGSAFHRTAPAGPLLGVMRAATLDDAIRMQNAVAGAVAGLQSLDPLEVERWLERCTAENLHVNRVFGGPFVGRRPHAGSGGPSALFRLGEWHPVPVPSDGDLRLDGLERRVREAIEAFQRDLDYAGFDEVRRGAYSDAAAWASEFGTTRDVAKLGAERNLLRYRPARVTVRLAGGGSTPALVRTLVAGVLATARVEVSAPAPLRGSSVGKELGWAFRVESDADFAARVHRDPPARIRLVGGDAAALGLPDSTTMWAGPVTAAGRVELLPYLREQSVTMTAHRHGLPDRRMLRLSV